MVAWEVGGWGGGGMLPTAFLILSLVIQVPTRSEGKDWACSTHTHTHTHRAHIHSHTHRVHTHTHSAHKLTVNSDDFSQQGAAVGARGSSFVVLPPPCGGGVGRDGCRVHLVPKVAILGGEGGRRGWGRRRWGRRGRDHGSHVLKWLHRGRGRGRG